MTNEEIEKRFEFDMNIGLFRSYVMDDTILFMFPNIDRTIYRLLKILENLGYEYNSDTKLKPSFLKFSKSFAIIIQSDIKKFYFTEPYYFEQQELPEYIHKYTLDKHYKRWSYND